MLGLGIGLLATGIVLLVLGGVSTARQIRSAGGDPSRGEFVYEREGGVSKATSLLMLTAWALVVLGVVLALIGMVA